MKAKFLKVIMAVSMASQVTYASEVPVPPHPGYANCPLIDVNVAGSAIPQKTIDSNCRNKVDSEHRAAVDAANRANRMITSEGVAEPQHPGPNTCGQVQTEYGSTADYACQSAYAAKVQDYARQKEGYEAFKEQQRQIEMQKEAAVQQRTSTSATNLLSDIKNKGEKESAGKQALSIAMSIGSAVAAAKFAATCSTAIGCQPQYLAISIALAIVSAKANKTSKQHADTARAACVSYNQMSTSGGSCGEIVPEKDPNVASNDAINSMFDPKTGQCKPDAPSNCQSIKNTLDETGVKTTDLKGAPNSFAGGLFKVNKDGTVTTKNGKTYKPSDFASKEAMIAAGFSPAEAAAAMNEMNGANGLASKLGLNAKEELKSIAANDKTDFGSFDSGSGGAITVKAPGEGEDKGGLGSKDMSGTGANGRKPSAAEDGLMRDFNGDVIGIASDDIFKMMNRRYILKTAQDSFIGQ